MSDAELQDLLEQEQRRLRSIDKVERAIARDVIQQIEQEQVRRYEAKWGL